MGDADVARGRAFHPPISDLLPNCERSVNARPALWRDGQEPGTLRKHPVVDGAFYSESGTMECRVGPSAQPRNRQEHHR